MRVQYYSQVWQNEMRNLGDWLTVPIVKALGHTVEDPEEGKPVLFGIGSVLGPDHYTAFKPSSVTVWGSGMMNLTDAAERENVKFLAVRGPLTRDRLGLPRNFPIGDPGLLLPQLLKLPEPQFPGQMLYVNHCGRPKVLTPDGFEGHVTMLTAESNALKLTGRIAKAMFVASESLHGCVIAQAYGVPWAPCTIGTDRPMGDKWNDWFAYLGLSLRQYFLPADPGCAWVWWDRVGRHAKTGNLSPLLKAFPAKLE